MDPIFAIEDDLQALYQLELERAQYEEWVKTGDYIDHVNSLIWDVLHGSELQS